MCQIISFHKLHGPRERVIAEIADSLHLRICDFVLDHRLVGVDVERYVDSLCTLIKADNCLAELEILRDELDNDARVDRINGILTRLLIS